MSNVWMRHDTYNTPCHIYEWVMSHIWTSHVTCKNESCPIQRGSRYPVDAPLRECHIQWVMSNVWMSHVTYNESRHTYEWVMSHITRLVIPTWLLSRRHLRVCHIHTCMNDVTCKESRQMNEWVMSHVWMSHVTYNESCHMYEWVMSHTYMCGWCHI